MHGYVIDALTQHVMIPAGVASLAAQSQLQGAIQLVQGFCPLYGFGSVGFFSRLFNLPASPDFVAESPVFNLSERSKLQYQGLEKYYGT
jgi:hypothetical protein